MKRGSVGAVLTLAGSWFHDLGPATQKALDPKFDRYLGTKSLKDDDDLRPGRPVDETQSSDK